MADDARIRRVLKEVLSSAEDCECVGAFAKGTDALESLPALSPDVIVMDVNLPDLSGVECVARLAPQLPGTQIIMLTVYQDPETIFQALAAGAHGYLVKPVMPEKLLEAIREIRAGPEVETFWPPPVESYRSLGSQIPAQSHEPNPNRR